MSVAAGREVGRTSRYSHTWQSQVFAYQKLFYPSLQLNACYCILAQLSCTNLTPEWTRSEWAWVFLFADDSWRTGLPQVLCVLTVYVVYMGVIIYLKAYPCFCALKDKHGLIGPSLSDSNPLRIRKPQYQTASSASSPPCPLITMTSLMDEVECMQSQGLGAWNHCLMYPPEPSQSPLFGRTRLARNKCCFKWLEWGFFYSLLWTWAKIQAV